MFITPLLLSNAGMGVFRPQPQCVRPLKFTLDRSIFSHTHATPLGRSFSAFHDSNSNVEQGRLAYIELQEASNQSKIDKVLNYTLANTWHIFGLTQSEGTVAQRWKALQNFLMESHEYQLPPFDTKDPLANIQALLTLFHRPLLKETTSIDAPNDADYIFTPTELVWAYHPVGVPFTRKEEKPKSISHIQDILDQCSSLRRLPQTLKNSQDQKIQNFALLYGEKDAAAATLLVAPQLDSTTLLYEVGCWNGQNLINLLLYASLNHQLPKYCIGIDINRQALNMAQSTAAIMAIYEPFIQFHLSNAIDPLNPRRLPLEYEKEVRTALRVIPVLEPSRGKEFLLKTRKALQNRHDILVVSFALPKGQMYEKNMQRAEKAPFKKELFSGGVVISQKFSPLEALPMYLQEGKSLYTVLNTYYTLEGFNKLVTECGFNMQHTIHVQDTDNDRIVAKLRPV